MKTPAKPTRIPIDFIGVRRSFRVRRCVIGNIISGIVANVRPANPDVT